jgi:LemA protein
VVSLLIFFGALAAIGLYFAVTYNQLVRLRNTIDNAWAEVNVLLRRRYDLIPNVVATVQGYAAHERRTFDEVTEARAQAEQAASVADQAHAENALTAALGKLFAVSEAYPQLQAAAGFQQLQTQLAQTETAIAGARQLYNDDVLVYQNKRQMVPTNIVAWFLGFGPREFFQLDAAMAQPPKIAFAETPARV